MNYPATIAACLAVGIAVWFLKPDRCPPPTTETLTMHVPDYRERDSLRIVNAELRAKAKADSIAYAESKTAPKYRPGMFKDSTTLRKLGFIRTGE